MRSPNLLGSGRTGWRVMWLLGVVVAALVATPLPADPPPPLPPPEALEDWPGYDRWTVLEIKIGRDGETAMVRLRHPEASKVIAVLHYELVFSSVIEVPNGAGGVAPEGP